MNAPMVQINDDFYECLTPETMKDVLRACKAGKPPALTKYGSRPMNGQVSCEGPMGKTSLKSPPTKPFCRDDLPRARDPADVAREMKYRQ